MLTKSEVAKLVATGAVTEVFHHGTLGVFDVGELREIVAQLAERGRRPNVCAFADVRAEDGSIDPHEFLISQREIDPARVRELTDEQLEEPLIFLLCPPETNGVGETHLLVDGIHRLVGRRARGFPDFRFWLIPLVLAPRVDARNAISIEWGKKVVRDGKLVDRE